MVQIIPCLLNFGDSNPQHVMYRARDMMQEKKRCGASNLFLLVIIIIIIILLLLLLLYCCCVFLISHKLGQKCYEKWMLPCLVSR